MATHAQLFAKNLGISESDLPNIEPVTYRGGAGNKSAQVIGYQWRGTPVAVPVSKAPEKITPSRGGYELPPTKIEGLKSEQVQASPQRIEYMSTLKGVVPIDQRKEITPPSDYQSAPYLDVKVRQPNIFERAAMAYQEFKQPTPTIMTKQTPSPVAKGILTYAYLSFPQKYSETAKTTQAFATYYPEESKLTKSFTAPYPAQLFRGSAISFAEGAVGGTAFKGTSMALNLGRGAKTLIGGGMAVASAPSLISGFKQDPIKATAFTASGILGFVYSPTPSVKPITFEKATFKEIQVTGEGSTLKAMGRIDLKRTLGLQYKEYIIPFKTKGKAIISDKRFALQYEQRGVMYEKGLGIFKETPKGILSDMQLAPQAVKTKGVMVGRTGDVLVTRSLRGMTLSKVLKGYMAKSVGITALRTPKGVQTQPFAGRTVGIELVSKPGKGSFILGKSKSFRANEVLINVNKNLRQVSIGAKGVSSRGLTAKGVTYVPETSQVFEGTSGKGLTSFFKSSLSKVAPVLPSPSTATALKIVPSSFAVVSKPSEKGLRYSSILKPVSISRTITTPKSIQMTKVIQPSREKPMSMQIQIPKSIQLFKPSEIQIPKSIQVPMMAQPTVQSVIPRSVQVAKSVSVPSMIVAPVIPFPIVSAQIIGGFPSFTFGSDSGSLGKRIVRGKQPKRYTPSFAALVLGIRGKAPKGIETGLRLRPIPKGFNILKLK